MKTRLLKRLRRKAKKNIAICKRLDLNFPYYVEDYWESMPYRTLEEAKIKLIEERRSYIIRVVMKMRIERENKQLRKL